MLFKLLIFVIAQIIQNVESLIRLSQDNYEYPNCGQ